MADKRLPFPDRNFARRLGLVRRAMAEAGLDALYVANLSLADRLRRWSFCVHQGVILGP